MRENTVVDGVLLAAAAAERVTSSSLNNLLTIRGAVDEHNLVLNIILLLITRAITNARDRKRVRIY